MFTKQPISMLQSEQCPNYAHDVKKQANSKGASLLSNAGRGFVLFMICLLFVSSSMMSFAKQTTFLGGTIVMMGEILRVSSGDANDPVARVEVYPLGKREPIIAQEGCYELDCVLKIKELPKATYEVRVYTLEGRSFAEKVERK